MAGLLKLIKAQTQVALRNKQIILCYYIIPLIFFFIFGAVLVKMDASAKESLPVSMTIFSISMGTLLGLSESINSLMKVEYFKAFYVMNVRIYKIILAEQISCGIHMIVQSCLIIILSRIFFDSGLLFQNTKCIFALFLYLIFVILVSSIIGLIAKGKNVVMVLGQLCFFITVFLGGIMFPISFLPELLQKIANVIPASMVISIRDNIDEYAFYKLALSVLLTLMMYVGAYWLKLKFNKE